MRKSRKSHEEELRRKRKAEIFRKRRGEAQRKHRIAMEKKPRAKGWEFVSTRGGIIWRLHMVRPPHRAGREAMRLGYRNLTPYRKNIIRSTKRVILLIIGIVLCMAILNLYVIVTIVYKQKQEDGFISGDELNTLMHVGSGMEDLVSLSQRTPVIWL